MEFRNLDGISVRRGRYRVAVHTVTVVAEVAAQPVSISAPVTPVKRGIGARSFTSIAVLLLVFVSGMWAAATTPWSKAADSSSVPQTAQVLAAETDEPSPVPVELLPEDQLFSSTPIEQMTSVYMSPTLAEVVTERTKKLIPFLKERQSPFVDYADVIASQPHWKLILAISFAESTLGKRCHSNNCSGIGVAPGHDLWREYPSFREWVIDFNKLLERRYRDKTLEQMCGVYVQPCNPNWLRATHQIITALDEAGIE